MKIVILGVTSRIGRESATAFHRKGNGVWVLDRKELDMEDLQTKWLNSGKIRPNRQKGK